jgi:hypothetical protein
VISGGTNQVLTTITAWSNCSQRDLMLKNNAILLPIFFS